MEAPICRRCLLKDMGDDEYYRTIAEYVQELSPSIKTPEKIYADRLQQCRDCANLINGMCRLCGCFVELRAAKKINSCPDSPPRWKSVS
ncbi:MAG: DUF6171 family protein [Candidatus Merdivicinus sp.]|jgi:hypothetical protein